MEELTVVEAKRIIGKYLKMKERLDFLKLAKSQVSDYYYASHSMTGINVYDRESSHLFQTSVQPENGAMDIVFEEQAIQKQIDRLAKRIGYLNERLPNVALDQLTLLHQDTELHDSEKQFLETVIDIEEQCREEKRLELKSLDVELDGINDEEILEQHEFKSEKESILAVIAEVMNT